MGAEIGTHRGKPGSGSGNLNGAETRLPRPPAVAEDGVLRADVQAPLAFQREPEPVRTHNLQVSDLPAN